MKTISAALVLFALLVSAAPATENAATENPTKLSPQEAAEGFVSLFDGTSFDAWKQPVPKGFEAKDGILLVGDAQGKDLYTKKEYEDFILRLDIRMQPGSNNGIGIRSPLGPKRASYSGMEVQVLDDTSYPREINGKMYHLKPYQYHGSVYGLVPAEPGHLKPVGEWNAEEIVCKGRRVKVTLNGTVIVDANLDDVPDEMKNNPGGLGAGWNRKKGHVVIISHSGGTIEFRNIRIKEFPAE